MSAGDLKSAFDLYVPLPRVAAWTTLLSAYILGTLAQLFAFLPTLVLRSRQNPELWLDYFVRGISLVCLLLALFLFRRYWLLPKRPKPTLQNASRLPRLSKLYLLSSV